MAEAAAAAVPAATEGKAPAPVKAGIPIKLVIIVGGAALLLGLGGAIAYFKLTAEHKAEAPAAEAAAPAAEAKPAAEEHGKPAAGKSTPGTIVDLDPFIVNLADTPDVRYLKLTLKIELDRPDAAADVTARLPQIRDAILILLSGKDSNALRSTQGKFQLRDDITLRVNAVLPRPSVRTAYFTEFVIQ